MKERLATAIRSWVRLVEGKGQLAEKHRRHCPPTLYQFLYPPLLFYNCVADPRINLTVGVQYVGNR